MPSSHTHSQGIGTKLGEDTVKSPDPVVKAGLDAHARTHTIEQGQRFEMLGTHSSKQLCAFSPLNF